MSSEMFYLLSKVKERNLEKELVLQCAPVIMGLKISNLFTISKEESYYLKDILKDSILTYRILAKLHHKYVILIYHEKELYAYLMQQQVKELLDTYGYCEASLDCLLQKFSKRYHHYLIGEYEFPHEMGIFLGYPLEDVKGFIEFNGKESLYVGYWKVYSKLEEKLALFQKYDEAQSRLLHSLIDGIKLQDLLKVA